MKSQDLNKNKGVLRALSIRALFVALIFSILIVSIGTLTVFGTISIESVIRSQSGDLLILLLERNIDKLQSTVKLLGDVGLADSKEHVDSAKNEMIEGIKQFKHKNSGHIYVLDSQFKVVQHASISPGTDLSGLGYVRKLAEQKNAIVKYESQDGLNRVAVSRSFPDWGWHLVLEMTREEFQQERDAFVKKSLGIASLCLILSLACGFLISTSITNRVKRIIKGLNSGAEQVASASSQVSAASQSLAEGASEQAAAIEETSSSLEEIASMTKQNAGNASQANTLATETKATTESCSGTMEEMAAAIGEVSESARETQKIVKVIDEIAFQTNLLALNAAVEAARAGEAGAGFAVVADEVRNLALRAAEAAKNTTERIEDINKKVNGSMEMVSKTVDEFGRVDENTKKVSELVAEIAAASNEQAQGIDQVNNAVAEMDKIVQRNAASAQETASASEEMSAQAEEMQGFVRELNATVGGRKGEGAQEQTIGRPADKTGEARKRSRGTAPLLSAPKGGERAMTGRSRRKATPEEIIPLKEDEFEDF